MEPREILQIIWKRLWLIVLGMLVVSAAAYVVSELRTPVYQAKVTIMVNQTADTPLADLTSLSTGERLAQTYSQLLKARPLLEIVISNLDLDLTPEYLVEKRIATNLVPGTQLLELTVKDPDPRRASDIANEIALTFISMHNTEQQLQDISQLEEDIVAEISSLKDLIQRNRIEMSQLRSSGLLPEGESNPVESTLASQQNAYGSLLGTYLSVRKLQTQMLDVTVVEPAVPPIKPIGHSAVFYALLGAVIGLSLNVGLVLLLEYLDRSFETSDDVSQVLSLPTLGTIPQLQGRERRSPLVTSTDPHLAVSEAYRTLRTNIRFASIDRPLRTLLVTSAEPAAGKTTVATNLGIACAQAGLRVVLIDADLRRPQQHHLFDIENQSGLTDLLVRDVRDVEESLVGTGTDGLNLIPSGHTPPNPSELLDSKRMEAVLAEIKENVDLVILDSPPLLVVTDAAALGPKVDGVILVIMARRTSHEAARKSYEALQSVNANVVGVVLVGVRRRGSAYYYYAAEKQSRRRSRQRRHKRMTKPLRQHPISGERASSEP